MGQHGEIRLGGGSYHAGDIHPTRAAKKIGTRLTDCRLPTAAGAASDGAMLDICSKWQVVHARGIHVAKRSSRQSSCGQYCRGRGADHDGAQLLLLLLDDRWSCPGQLRGKRKPGQRGHTLTPNTGGLRQFIPRYPTTPPLVKCEAIIVHRWANPRHQRPPQRPKSSKSRAGILPPNSN